MKKIILFTLIVLISTILYSCKKDSGMYTVKYTIQGTSKLNITYTDANGNVQSANNVDASWTYSFSSSFEGAVLKLTVISSDGSQVGAKIFIDGLQAAQSNGVTGSTTVSAVLQ